MKKRAVLAGCGAMSKGWLSAIADTPGLAERVEIVGLSDIAPTAAIARAEEFGLSTALVSENLDQLLSELRPDVLFDVVVPDAREAVVTAGLQRGCHVLSEKPMALGLESAQRLIAAADKASRVHAIVQNRRFNTGVRRLRAVLESGALGRLTAIHADFFVGAHFGGFREEMQHVLLLDMAIHTFDAARFLSNASPVAVYCQELNPAGSWYAHGSVANAIFEFSDDVSFTYRGSWSAEGDNTSWDASWRIIGSKGTLLWDGADQISGHVVAGNEGFFRPLESLDIPAAPDANETMGHASVLLEFLDAIEEGRAPETAGTDNIKSLAMVFSAIESARLKQRVEISQ